VGLLWRFGGATRRDNYTINWTYEIQKNLRRGFLFFLNLGEKLEDFQLQIESKRNSCYLGLRRMGGQENT